MKLSKIVLLLASASMLVGCTFSKQETRTESHSEFYTHFTTVDAVSSKENTTSNENKVSSSQQTVSSSATTTSSVITTSSVTPTGTELLVNFYNPSCGSLSKEVISERLATYINEVASTTFVTSITSNDCQVTNDSPNAGDKILQLGAGSKTGSMTFNFVNTIKSVTIVAQTYHKPYTDNWTDPDNPVVHPNVDPNSQLRITTVGTDPVFTTDLRSSDDTVIEKETTVAMSSKTLTLQSVTADKGRVFIKSIKFVY